MQAFLTFTLDENSQFDAPAALLESKKPVPKAGTETRSERAGEEKAIYRAENQNPIVQPITHTQY
jgi:hypothetical protein